MCTASLLVCRIVLHEPYETLRVAPTIMATCVHLVTNSLRIYMAYGDLWSRRYEEERSFMWARSPYLGQYGSQWEPTTLDSTIEREEQ